MYAWILFLLIKMIWSKIDPGQAHLSNSEVKKPLRWEVKHRPVFFSCPVDAALTVRLVYWNGAPAQWQLVKLLTCRSWKLYQNLSDQHIFFSFNLLWPLFLLQGSLLQLALSFHPLQSLGLPEYWGHRVFSFISLSTSCFLKSSFRFSPSFSFNVIFSFSSRVWHLWLLFWSSAFFDGPEIQNVTASFGPHLPFLGQSLDLLVFLFEELFQLTHFFAPLVFWTLVIKRSFCFLPVLLCLEALLKRIFSLLKMLSFPIVLIFETTTGCYSFFIFCL